MSAVLSAPIRRPRAIVAAVPIPLLCRRAEQHNVGAFGIDSGEKRGFVRAGGEDRTVLRAEGGGEHEARCFARVGDEDSEGARPQRPPPEDLAVIER